MARIEAGAYRVAILNADLRGLEEDGLAARLRAMRPEMHVVLLGDGERPSAALRALRERVLAFVTKPFTASAIGERSRKRCTRRPGRRISWSNPDGRGGSRSGRAAMRIPRTGWSTFCGNCKRTCPPRRAKMRPRRSGRLLMNAVEHGCHYDPAQWVRVSLIRTARSLVFHVQDPGSGFSFERIPHAAVSNPPDSPVRHLEVRSEQGVRPGGFGILLTRNLVDELLYNEAGNEVLCIKYL